MKRKMNIFTWMGIFLVLIQSGGCDSSFRERSIRGISRREFDSSNRINRYRILDEKKFLLGNSLKFEVETDTSASDSETGEIFPSKLTRETFQTPLKKTQNFSDKKIRNRRISMIERRTSKSVIEFSPDMRNGIQVSKVLALNDYTSLKTGESTRIRHDITIQRSFSNERKNRLSEDRRMNQFRENIRSRRLNIRQERNYDERMSNMRFRDNGIRKTFRLAKLTILDPTPSESSESGRFRRQNRLVIPKEFSFKGRVIRNAIRQEANSIERFVREDKYNRRNAPNLKLSVISMQRNMDSKLQQPRYERHLLVPKRELKIPSDEVRVRAENSRRSRKSIRTNDITQGVMVEAADERINGRGLIRTLDKRMDSSRRQSTEAIVRHRQNRMALLELGRIRNQLQTRKSAQNSGIESSGRIQSRQRTDALSFRIRNREVSSRKNTASSQTLENNKQLQTRRNARVLHIESSERMWHRQRTDTLVSNRRDREVSNRTITTIFQDIENNNSFRKLRTNELHSNRYSDKRFSRRSANVFTSERIRFDQERRLSNENRQLRMRGSSKENIPNDLRIHIRKVRNQDRARDMLKNGMWRDVKDEQELKQQKARSFEIFSTQYRSQSSNERSIPMVDNKFRETRSRHRDLRIRNRRIGRLTDVENSRRSIMKLKTYLNEVFIKSSDKIRTSANRDIVNVRNIITSSPRLEGNSQIARSDDKEIRSIDINIRNANRRTATNKRLISNQQRTRSLVWGTENNRSFRKDLGRQRKDVSRNRRSEPRINVGQILRNHRNRDELKQSKLRVSADLTKEASVRTTTQTRKEISSRTCEQRARSISVRSVPKHLILTSKLHSTATNFTFKDNIRGFPVSKFREIVSSKKPIVSSDRTAKLYRTITAPKSSSSNKSFMDFYEYLSEKRGSFISLILNVTLGLAVIVASSDDKNKGFIPRRLTPFVDGFLKYTTVL